MGEVRVGDILKFSRGRADIASYTYHVRGQDDGWLGVRFWCRKSPVGWRYECLSPAWWSVYRDEPGFRHVRRGAR